MLNRSLLSKKNPFLISWILLFAMMTLGCRSEAPTQAANRIVPNTSPQPIGILYRLAQSDVELAILLAVADPPQVPALEPGQEITDDVLPAVLGGTPPARRAGHPWSFVKREPGLIHANFESGSLRMLVAIMFDEQLVMLRIVESKNLGQQEGRIDSRAFTHLAELDGRIRRNVEAVAQRNWYGTPVPARPSR